MTRLADNISPVIPDELSIAVALGKVPGWEITSVWNENESVSTSQEEMSNIASGIRTLPTASSAITIASTSANDAAAGTGARTLVINYLDSSFEEQSVTLTLNGTSNVVSTPTDAFRFVSATILTVGSGLQPAGNISITIDSNVQARILAGQNESRETGFCVPIRRRWLSSNAVIATGRAGSVDVDVAFEYRLPSSDVWITARSLQSYQTITTFDVIGVAALPAGTDFRVLSRATGGSGPAAYVQVRGFYIDNEFFSA